MILDNRAPAVSPLNCVRSIHRLSSCRLCLDGCSKGALSLSPVKIDNDLCDGCGICAGVCPIGAFKPRRFSYGSLSGIVKSRLSTAANKTLIFSCEDDGTGRVCLAAFDKASLILPIFLGAPTVGLDASRCHDCEVRGLPHILNNIVAANDLLRLARIDNEPIALLTEKPGRNAGRQATGLEGSPNFGRRRFLRLMRKETVKTGFQLYGIDIGKPRGSARRASGAPLKQRVLVGLVRKLAETADEDAPVSDDVLRQPKIGDGCTGCGYCSAFCPTAALTIETGERRLKIKFKASACVSCLLCADICAAKAVSFENTANVRQYLLGVEIDLLVRDLTECPVCGEFHIGADGKTCPKCSRLDAAAALYTSLYH